MRVRHTVSVLVAVCTVGGVGLALGLATGFNEHARKTRLVSASPAALSEWARFADASAQWLTICDLLLASGQDLLASDALRQASHLDMLAEHVAEFDLASDSRLDLAQLRSRIENAKGILAEAETLTGTGRAARLSELLSSFDSTTAVFPDLIFNVQTNMQRAADEKRAELELHKQTLLTRTATAVVAYLVSVLIAWRWASATVTSPLSKLTAAASAAESGGGRLEFENSGPTEVCELAESVSSFARRLESANQVMEQTIEVRTAELVRSNRIKDEFLATISHEIRTPTNAVTGVLQLLSRTVTDEQQRAWIELATRSGRSLTRLIDDILDFSGIEVGTLKLELAEFDMRAVADEQISLLMIQERASNLEISLDVDPRFPKVVVGDETRIRQVLFSLLGNACKFTHRGFIRLVLSGEPGSNGEWMVEVRVEDTGIGISEDRIADIFDPFTQSDGSTTREYGGAGLGLTLVKRIIESMGGAVGVSSETEVGSTFWFTLRVRDVSGDARDATSDEGDSSGETGIATRETRRDKADEFAPLGLSVLVVEDNHVNQIVILAMLDVLGCTAECAQDGVVAIEKISEQSFDMVLMDCHMPRMDGFDATARIRELVMDMPVVGVSAGSSGNERERSLQAGMNEFINKPVALEQLHEVILRATRKPS